MLYFTKLKHSIINSYIGRKHGGMLALLYNTRDKKFIVVPTEMEHSDFVAFLLKVEVDDISNGNIDVSYFIPVTVIIAENKFSGIIVGISSLEMGCGVRHKKKDLINAANATEILLGRGPLQIKEKFSKLVQMKYAI